MNLTPKEKANELFEEYLRISPIAWSSKDPSEVLSKKIILSTQYARKAAEKMVEEILIVMEQESVSKIKINYWKKVKKTLESNFEE